MTFAKLRSATRRIFEYRLKPTYRLVREGKLGYFVGAVFEKAIDWNAYLWWLGRRNDNFLRIVDVMGFDMMIDLRDRGLGRHLYIRGEHEPLAAEVFRRELKRISDANDTTAVLDIGANIGYYTLQEASVTSGQVIAIEPDDRNRKLLRQNIQLNEYSHRVSIIPVAIGDTDGTASFLQSQKSNWSRIGHERDRRSDDVAETKTVEVRTIDSLLDEHEISSKGVRGVRMDLEGHESAVFRGMKTILESDVPIVLFVEFHPERLGNERFEEMLSMLEDNKFSICHVDQEQTKLPVTSYEALKRVEGTHVRVVFRRG